MIRLDPGEIFTEEEHQNMVEELRLLRRQVTRLAYWLGLMACLAGGWVLAEYLR